MRQAEAAQCSGSLQTTPALVALRVPGSSTPYSSMHQQSSPARSLLHCTRSNSPPLRQRGMRTDAATPPLNGCSALARRDSARRRCWQAVRLPGEEEEEAGGKELTYFRVIQLRHR